jgi:2-iminobutanoate/2-iminopropanoate deaminase
VRTAPSSTLATGIKPVRAYNHSARDLESLGWASTSSQAKVVTVIRHAVSTDDAPPAIGPYSQAIVANGFVFCSGTAGIDPATGVAPDGIEEQTEQALRNLDAILTAAGASLATVVKTTIFYTNVEDFATINAVYSRFMPDPPPARSAPANVRLPRNLLISIEAIAVLPTQ